MDHVTLKTRGMMLKIQLWNNRNKLNFKLYTFILNYNNISHCFNFDQPW